MLSTMGKSLLPLLLLLGIVISVMGKIEYNCQRKNDCLNNGKCVNGLCECAGNFTGYNCEYTTASAAACTDNAKCQNGGTCYDADKCSCPYGFYGDSCKIENFDINCAGDMMSIKMVFDTPFNGAVKLENANPAGPSCNFTIETVNSNDEYTLSVSLNAPSTDGAAGVCGSDQVENTTDAATLESKYTIVVMVQYDKTIYTSLDELWYFTCVHSGVDNVVSKVVTGINTTFQNDMTQQNKNKTYSPIRISLMDMENGQLPAKMNVGSKFKLHIFLEDDTVYKAILIVDCTANNTLIAGDGQGQPKEYKLFENGCPTPKGSWVANVQISMPNMEVQTVDGKSIDLKAFRFVDSPKVGIRCNVKVCKQPNDPTCAIPTCGPNGPITPTTAAVPATDAAAPEVPTTEAAAPGVPPTEAAATEAARRRKRSAPEDERTVSTVITVIDPTYGENQGQQGSQASVEECLTMTEIMAALIVIGVVIVILFIACMVLTCLMLRRKSNKNVFEPMSTPSQKHGDRFQIPRPYVNEAYRGDI